jgi:hypothetical protein
MNAVDRLAAPDKPIAVYIVAAVGFLLFGLLAHDFPPFFYTCAAIAVLCFFQAYYQVHVLWLGILLLYVAGAIFYGWLLVMELVHLSKGDSTRVLLDFDDSVVFIAFVGLLFGVSYWLLRSRPRRRTQVSDV